MDTMERQFIDGFAEAARAIYAATYENDLVDEGDDPCMVADGASWEIVMRAMTLGRATARSAGELAGYAAAFGLVEPEIDASFLS